MSASTSAYWKGMAQEHRHNQPFFGDGGYSWGHLGGWDVRQAGPAEAGKKIGALRIALSQDRGYVVAIGAGSPIWRPLAHYDAITPDDLRRIRKVTIPRFFSENRCLHRGP